VLPVFLDVPLSHEPAVRLVQLEDALRERVDHVAVYYDPGALEATDFGSAKLDVRRVPVSWTTGYFHPKDVLLLVEDAEPDENGHREQRLLVGTLSANLTRAGWWENVEVGHVEEMRLDEKSSLRADVRRLILRVKDASPPGEEHLALEAIRRFVVKLDERRKATSGGVLHPRLYIGLAEDSEARESVPDFLERLMPRDLKVNLEVISPYFDDSEQAGTLGALVERFHPREVRVLLPRMPDGTALCNGRFYEAVRKLPNTRWGKLPADLLKSGPSEAAAPRRVHAKVYRFFSSSPIYEALFVGSVNLTSAGHLRGGNFETAFLIELELRRAPDWWLSVDGTKPALFQATSEEEGLDQGPGAALMLRFSWGSGEAMAFWDGPETSPGLGLEAPEGVQLFALGPLKPRQWTALSAEQSEALGRILPSTSFVTVRVEGKIATILVQEQGMAHKPSILLNLTVSDILRCWASLTPEQKAILLDERYQELAGSISALVTKAPLGRLETASVFDAFAGIFHAFGCLERGVLKALQTGREKEAVYLLFGKKYDSLPRLLDRVLNEEKELENVRRYVILLCARQLLDRVRSEAPEAFRTAHRQEFRALDSRVEKAGELQESFEFGTDEERRRFFDWFEAWFLKRAQAPEATRA
jgi:hypothetical protein